MSATSLAQVSQYFRSPHFSTILAKIAPGGRSSGGKDSSPGLKLSSELSIRPPLKMILFVGVSLRSILLISASNLSSCERNARNTPQTAANLSLSSRGRSGFDARRYGHREYDVAILLALGLPHGATNGLDDIDLGVSRVHEEHGIKCGYVNAFGQATGIRENAAGSLGTPLQPLDPGVCAPSA